MTNSADAFYRTDMLPPREPPLSQRGPVKWGRENLFSSPLNALLTVIGTAIVVFMVASIFPWLEHGVWNASSLNECRDIVTRTWGAGAHGACWAVIHERWNQYLYGFYPNEDYWRPNLAFALMLAALAPILFNQLPRKLLWFSAGFPALAYWLIWGGEFWVVITILAAFAAGWLAYRALGLLTTAVPVLRPVSAPIALLGTVLVVVGWWLYAAGPVADALESVIPIHLDFVPSDKLGGFLLSFIIGICGIVFSLPLGILLSLGRRSDMPLIKTFCVMFIEFIRGVPLITLLFTASFLLAYFLPPGTSFDLVLRVVIMVTLFSAAYIAEVIRGGLAALPRGQYEAADALGLDYWKAQRLIIMPQALKISIPGIVSSFIGLFKDTTLVIFVSLLDPLKGITDAVRGDAAWNGVYWEPYIFSGSIFFIFCFGMSRYSQYLERKLKTDHR